MPSPERRNNGDYKLQLQPQVAFFLPSPLVGEESNSIRLTLCAKVVENALAFASAWIAYSNSKIFIIGKIEK